jgi:leucyl aminopeptidase
MHHAAVAVSTDAGAVNRRTGASRLRDLRVPLTARTMRPGCTSSADLEKEPIRVKIQVAKGAAPAVEVTINVACSPDKPSPHDVGSTVGDVRVADRTAPKGKGPGTTIVVSLGPKEKVDVESVRCAGGAAGRWLTERGVRRACFDPAGLVDLRIDDAVPAFCEGLTLGAYGFDQYKTDRKSRREGTVYVIGRRGAATSTQAIQRITKVAEAVNLTREWAHEPPNVVNPVTLAKRVAKMARNCGLKCTVYDERQLAKMKAEALIAVGVASKTPSRLIVLEHGMGGNQRAKPVVVVGKAITFDTGGYSLKDKTGIVGMKYDKCGGMAVVGVLKAAAALRLKTPVVGIIAAAENMISGEAYRPNDIIKTMSGKTVEIISTDAEGRMVLADALTYAQKHYRPRAIIDLATLTGGVVVALGSVRAGLFASDEALADRLTESGDRVHERLWRLPLDDEYVELIKGDDSDLKNSGGRMAHPIIAAVFLKQFINKKIPWAHLDIAGVADAEKDLPYCPKGATGFGVRLLIDYLSRK